MAIYVSRRNKIEESSDHDVNTVVVRFFKARLKIDFDFYKFTYNVEEFRNIWCLKNVSCFVEENVFFGVDVELT